MEWESPWGIGFPGWHIECSAMSMKYLGESFDIHVGGEDLRSTHHPNEIAQSEGATGKPFVKYWIHVTFLKVDGKRMSKSRGNIYTIGDVKEKGFEPVALRYLYLTAHYKDSLNFTWKALSSSQKALARLREQVRQVKSEKGRVSLSREKGQKIDALRDEFLNAVNDDLNTSRALAVVWDMLKSNVPSRDKYDLVTYFDEVLGLGLDKVSKPKVQIPNEIKRLGAERERLRKEKKFKEADKIRIKIKAKGFLLEDAPKGVRIKKM